MFENYRWRFKEQSPGIPSGSNLAEPNFARESRNIENVFLRELDQNILDARVTLPSGEREKAKLTISILDSDTGLDSDMVKEIFYPLEEHLVAAGHDESERDWCSPRVLVVEEFGTVGLTGTVSNAYEDGEEQRWSNFWFGEGKKNKTGSSLGRQGQGKITYHVISGARSVLAITRREQENKDYLFGKCIVRDTHELNGKHYIHHGYWPLMGSDGETPSPEIESSKIKEIKKIFGLARNNETGTSWIIPFIPNDFEKDNLVREFVKDFFFSVLSGSLEANICGEQIDSSNVSDIFHRYGIEQPSKNFFEFIVNSLNIPKQDYIKANKGWIGKKFDDGSFSEKDLESLRSKFKNDKTVSVVAPIEITKKDGSVIDSEIELHLRGGIERGNGEEIYVRSGLNIVDENHLYSHTRSAYGMMQANDAGISEFLGYCEEASHMEWKNNEKEALDRYESVRSRLGPLAAVRQSLPLLYRLLAGSSENVIEEAFEDILSIPPEPRPKQPELFECDGSGGRWKLIPSEDASLNADLFPIKVQVIMAYDRIEGTGNVWRKYHPFDFNLSDDSFAPIHSNNITVHSRKLNKLDLTIESSDFEIELSGFSTEIPLRSKVEYNVK